MTRLHPAVAALAASAAPQQDPLGRAAEWGLLKAVARQAVPALGDACSIYVFESAQPARRGAVAHAVAHGATDDATSAQVAARIAPAAHEVTADPQVRQRARAAAAEAGGEWELIAPLLADGQVIGALTVVSGAPFDDAAVSAAVALAAQAALAVQSASLHEVAVRAKAQAQVALERTFRLQAVTQALSGATTREDLVDITVMQGVHALGAKAGSVALLDDRGDRVLIRASGYDPRAMSAWREVPLEARFPMSDVVREGDSIFLRDLGERLARYPHLEELARQNGGGGMAAVPVWLDGRPVGAIGLTFAEPRTFDDSDRAFVTTLSRLCGQALERLRHLEAEQRARARLELIANAGRVLSSTLDYEQTLHNVAGLLVPHLGDFCFFDLREESGEVRRIARVHEDPKLQQMLDGSGWAPNHKPELDLCALTNGRAGLHPHIDDAFYQRMAASEAHLALLRELDFCSLLTVPMHIGDELVGALTMAYARSRRRHGPEELALAGELARRAAVAVQNARLLRETQRAVSLRDEFLSVAGHELNTPLTTLKLQLLSLARHGGVTKGFEPKLHAANRQADRLARLVRALLDVSRFETGRLVLELKPVELVAMLQDVIARHCDNPEQTGTLTLVAPERVVVQADPLRLDQLLGNLVSNALKYGEGREVEVQVEIDAAADKVRVRVRDQGIGVAPEDQERVFDRFQRAVSSVHYGGFGVGLWIVREVAHAHGGTVTLQSTPGQGSTFCVELPIGGPGSQSPDSR